MLYFIENRGVSKVRSKFKNIINSIKAKKFSPLTIVFLSIILVLVVFLVITLSRYVSNLIREGLFRTEAFYFNSDKLNENVAAYQLNNWSGADAYTVVVNMNSMKNNETGADVDIAYAIEISCSNNVLCDLSKNEGIIFSVTNTDVFTATIRPNATFTDGDSATFAITASSTSPYKKTIKGEFTLVVGREGLSYEIQDISRRTFLELRITNTLSYYTVKTAFGSYNVGDRLDERTYRELSPTDRANASSAILTLTFNPNDVVLDMTSKVFLRSFNTQTITIGGIEYINRISFEMDALSSEIVTFYKKNITNNYTYPFVSNTPIITVGYEA